MAILYKKDQYNLLTGDFDYLDQLTPFAILNYFQEMASRHAEEIGIGYKAMVDKNLAWITVKTKFVILKSPKVNSQVCIQTWPKVPKRVEYDRDYLITDNDEILVMGRSKWCLVDLTTRSINRHQKIDYNGEYYEKNFLEEDFSRIDKLPKEQLTYVYSYVVRKSSLDHYGHMNNAKYANYIYDVLGDQEQIYSFEINYIKEALCGDEIAIYVKKELKEIFVYGYKEDTLLFSGKICLK